MDTVKLQQCYIDRMNYCPCYHFEFFPKGFQVKYERNNNATRQFIPYAQILTAHLEYVYDEKIHVLTIHLTQSIKYSYTFKSREEAEKIYEAIIGGI